MEYYLVRHGAVWVTCAEKKMLHVLYSLCWIVSVIISYFFLQTWPSKSGFLYHSTYVIDILRGQKVKLIQLEWKLMERPYFFLIYSLWFFKGLRSLKNWLLQQLSIKSLDQNLDFSLKSRYFGFEKNTAIPSIFMTPVLYTVTL